ncbi:hypothetical protein ACFWA5_02115 [Streptomyces mirabilis]|uniref:hypothetical protein n=1 Tax=Streptomyces mirabilis TaxID=68239 RepID=UPI003659B899
MQIRIDVLEGDWVVVSRGPYGGKVSWTLDKLISAGEFEATDGLERWAELLRRAGEGTFEIVVPDMEMERLTVGELRDLCLAEARRVGAADPVDGPARDESDRLVLYVPTIRDVWLSDPVTGKRLPKRKQVSDIGLADGDLLVLCIKHDSGLAHSLSSPRNPAELLKWIQVAENAKAPAGGPRLWGVLLYTDADAELATYVRTHFDDLNVLSGPATRVFVVERRARWKDAKRYWRQHLEPELYRVMSTMRWLQWTPYESQGAYEIASLLGLGPELLPCLVFFHSSEGPIHEGEKIVFPIAHTSTAYLRTLFGGIRQALRPVSESIVTPRAEENRRWLQALGPTSEYYQRTESSETGKHATAPAAVRNLLVPSPATDASNRLWSMLTPYKTRRHGPAPGRAADAAAFAAVREAEQAIRATLRPLVPGAEGVAINNSRVVIVSGRAGAEVSENFYFQGENTTFINRPRETVIQDFQNTYSSLPGGDELTRLLQLILSSRDLSEADREEAAGTVHDLARLGTSTQPDVAAARTRMERLRELVTSSADIVQPALAIIASVATFFGG